MSADRQVADPPGVFRQREGKTKGFNLASPAQLGDVLAMVGVPLKAKVNEKTGKTSYSCDKNILAFYLSDFEVLRLYKEYKNAATRTAMVEKLIGIAEKDINNRIHARYNQMVRTGAWCIDPKQQILRKSIEKASLLNQATC